LAGAGRIAEATAHSYCAESENSITFTLWNMMKVSSVQAMFLM
jgi:hypothetical protein